MVEINLFEIPDFLRDSELGVNLLEESRDYKVGSYDWIRSMRKMVEVKIFAENDEVNNIEEFENLIDVCDYWGRPICASIYIYYLRNRSECDLILIKRYFPDYERVKYISEEVNRTIRIVHWAYICDEPGKYIKNLSLEEEDLIRRMLMYSITKGVDLLLGSVQVMEDDKYLYEKGEKFSNDKIKLFTLHSMLSEFVDKYKNRSDIIENIPLIPFDKNQELITHSDQLYFLEPIIYDYSINGFVETHGEKSLKYYEIKINIYLNSTKIGMLNCDIRLLNAIATCLNKNIEFKTANINYKDNYKNNFLSIGNINYNCLTIKVNQNLIDNFNKTNNLFFNTLQKYSNKEIDLSNTYRILPNSELHLT